MFDQAALADGVITYSVDSSLFGFDSHIDNYFSALGAQLGVDFVEVMPDYNYGSRKNTVSSEAEFQLYGETASRTGGGYVIDGVDPITLTVNKDAGGPNVRSLLEYGIVEALGGQSVDELTGIYGTGDGTTSGTSFDANELWQWVYKGRGARLQDKLTDPSQAPV